MNKKRIPLFVGTLIATPLLFSAGGATALEPIEELGKNIFFDEISIPGNKQGCFSCHDLEKGGILPNSKINLTTVVAPGAAPHALGNIKPPSNMYVSTITPNFQNSPGPAPLPWLGGNFWDGRAEGYGATGAADPVGDGAASETIRVTDLPNLPPRPFNAARIKNDTNRKYDAYLGPTADQALNPFPNNVEQNIREKNVCQRVKTAKYKDLYPLAFGEPIDCSPNPKGNPAYKRSYKLFAVALAGYQASTEVNRFDSRRDKALNKNRAFPSADLSPAENLGHDLFYNRNDSGLNTRGKRANCLFCHNGVPAGEAGDPTGVAKHQLYSDNRYHNIGTPFNREIPGVAKGEKTGLTAHVKSVLPGNFRSPTARNVGMGLIGDFKKAYFHNGWCKSLECVVHFYNTRDDFDPNDPFKPVARCEALGIVNATAKEAKDHNCWPEPEFNTNPAVAGGLVTGIIGRIGLNAEEEAALVAYLKSLTDGEELD